MTLSNSKLKNFVLINYRTVGKVTPRNSVAVARSPSTSSQDKENLEEEGERDKPFLIIERLISLVCNLIE